MAHTKQEAPVLDSVSMAQRVLDSTVKVTTGGGHGSGAVVGKGVVLTAAHVVDGLEDMPVIRARGGEVCPVTRGVILVGMDAALLWYTGCKALKPLRVAKEEALEGETVYLAGAPLDAEWSITKGILSDADYTYAGIRYYVSDSVAHPGMSGGPMVNSRGELIGVVVRILTPGGYAWGGKTLCVPAAETLKDLEASGVPL
jgi:S1-C subfamily serine protease